MSLTRPPRRLDAAAWTRRYRRLTRRCHGHDDEAGSVLVISAVALVGLMLCAAMAVDLGNVSQTKQHAETAVQDAVLAAVPQLVPLFSTSSPSASAIASAEALAVSQAETYLEANYSGVTAADFSAPGACSGALPAGITLTSATDCIGFFAPTGTTPYAMGVAIPPRTVNYTFGRAGGLTSQSVPALAYASLEEATGDSGGFPFSYISGGPSGLQCLKAGSGGNNTCTGFTTGSGQFGMIDSPRYRIFPGNSTSNGQDPVLKTDMVLGFDHSLHVIGYQGVTTEICDSAKANGSCPDYNGQPGQWDTGNAIMPSTGQVQNDLTQAMFTGSFTTPDNSCYIKLPLLAHPDGFKPDGVCADDNYAGAGASQPFLLQADTLNSPYTDLNGRSIAYYLDGTGQQLMASQEPGCTSPDPGAVPLDQTAGNSYTWSSYDTCLSQLVQSIAPTPTTVVPPSSQIFSASIAASPRFGQVPLVSSNTGSNPEEILGWADVYLDMAFSKGGKVSSIVAWVFPPSMVENSSNASSVGGAGYVGGSYVPYLCSYGVSPC